MVVPIVVVPVFADVMTNMTRHGSRSPQESDDLVCTSSCQYKPFWWSRELCMTAGSLSPQLSYVCFEVHMLETNERAPSNVLVCSTNVKAEVPRHGTPQGVRRGQCWMEQKQQDFNICVWSTLVNALGDWTTG